MFRYPLTLFSACLFINSIIFGGQESQEKSASTQLPCRARHLGIPLEGIPGLLNAITDVKGVEVGQTT